MMDKQNSRDVQIVIRKVEATIKSHELAEDKSSILVAVSGGADSICLLHVLNRISKKKGYKLYVAHLNHQIRGEEADGDEEFVKNFCEGLKIKFFSKSVDIPMLSHKMKISEEDAGRKSRYEFFSELCAKHKIDHIATAHNQNDQAETVLMRLGRGTGLNGLRGIKYKREDGVIRPLLDVSRKQIEDYCMELNLAYRHDSTNDDDNYTRNKVRHVVLPMLEKELNPNIVSALSGVSALLGEDADFIEAYTKRLYNRLNPPVMKGGFKALHVKSLNMIDSISVISRLIILCARDEMGQGYSLERKHIMSIIAMLGDDGGNRVLLPDGLSVEKRYGWLEFKKRHENSEKQKTTEKFRKKELNLYNNKKFCIEVQVNKLYNIKDIGAKVELELTDISKVSKSNDLFLDADTIGIKDINNLEANKQKFFIRNRKDGDRIVIYKNGKSKKLKSFFIDKKIRREERDKIPLLCDENDNILAVLGYRVSENHKVSRLTQNVMVIHYERDED